MQQQLEASDAIIRSRNQEIAALNSRLAGKDEIIAEAAEQIERLEFELASRPKQNSKNPEPLNPIELTKKLNALITKRNKFLATEDVARILKE
ncbi:hypothetical protein QUB68_10460 [Microcoleus sp. A006_D1]|uniref:hypothetical protein n=1 Tax=Microcoleus sp. A006_D1 TaxID=3055267 RepID=UPI002FD799EA